ncbi:PREDICTED: solute carrier family 25 member 38-A-like [Priapulus caudatus]|uniref:Mitochondrial glycine transporter n=1 Tax=Priapulus caudatus TaxID=37621 RepID=A0ABM1F3N7_PRICU|nr:PREDICTED: solute carrier family 25 member 38-A-like [Priapulus caudatus]XP_014679065.1 PREDICTED: solute carrier family 25 member 38-A-like [Priapulus caudatus]
MATHTWASSSIATASDAVKVQSSVHPMVQSFVVGAFSGTCSTIIFQPLDLVKTRIQAPATVGQVHPGMVMFVVNLVKNESPLALWKGLTPSLIRCAPGVGIYFCSLHGLKSAFGSTGSGGLESMMFGATARSIAVLLLLPFTVLKTRFESQHYKYGSIQKAFHHIYKHEGMKGLYSGLLATLLRDCPFSGLYLMFYKQTHNLVPKQTMEGQYVPLVHFSCGIVSGVLASAATQPADVIKTKIQIFPGRFSSVTHVVRYVYRVYGIQGYFKGLIPRTMRRTMMAAMAWTVYEQVMSNFGLGQN